MKMLLGAISAGTLLLLSDLSMINKSSFVPVEYLNAEVEEGTDFYPDKILESEWGNDVEPADLVHLGLMQEACLKFKNSVVTWKYGRDGVVSNASRDIFNKDDVQLLKKMRQCPDVDVYMPGRFRNHGYCEDSAAYMKFLETRILPTWALTMKYMDDATNETFSYHDLCPKTPMLFLSHYWNGLPESPDWPITKQVYLMPNIEMYELRAAHYWTVDVVLCKTAICARYVRMWYQQEGNPRHTKVLYTRHTTSDIASLARTRLGEDSIKPRNWSDVHFVHVIGGSAYKGTSAVLDCWISRPDFPPLDVYMDERFYNKRLKAEYKSKTRDSQVVTIHRGRSPTNEFGKLIAESAFFMCPSKMEGYGHYINQARASGGLIVSTDLPPMNELLTPASGVLITVKRQAHPRQMLGGLFVGEHGLKEVEGFVGAVQGSGVCQAVETVLAMTPAEREMMGARAKRQYFVDMKFFASKMKELRTLAHEIGVPRFRSTDAV
uniref:Glycosyl transferase family 1 domain-containing protein n=1 Tax=Hyaloperonospora arabidopsidis (strain Emoy2) TaxID=559515 RepID=M4C2D9_HYAAE